MRISLKITMVLAVATLLSAPASAEWFGYGSFEPDTRYDTQEWMWQDAPEDATNRIYFNVVSGQNVVPTSFGEPTINPNVGLLHTRFETNTLEVQHGFLGVWIDCNGDDYIGLAESAMREYPAALLSSTSRCPAGGGSLISGGAWQPGSHNFNGWVSELVPIVNFASALDTRVYADPEARVWGDFDRPDERPVQRNCPTRPLPRGTLETTGGLLNYLDCRTDLLGPWNFAMGLVGDPAGLTFPDEDNARTGTAGQLRILGPEHTDHAAVHAVDCDDDATPVGPYYVRAPNPSLGPAADDPSDITIHGQINRTYEEILDDCDSTNDAGREIIEFGIFSIESSSFNSVNPNNKTEANWNFRSDQYPRGASPFTVVGGGSGGIPQDGGHNFGGTRWFSDSTWTKFGPRTVRYDLDSSSVGIAPAYWLTFHARLGSATFEAGFVRPGDEVGTYGDWVCGSAQSGIIQGWNCDTSLWYRNVDGSHSSTRPRDQLAIPGWKYHMRDVDCYDGGIEDVGVGIQPAYYGVDSCANG